ncbi:hypothetical protein GF617_24890, partial [Lelliottia sp. RWM.1]|nr:hypothetical protein [Lelliottia sp. RWM.1]
MPENPASYRVVRTKSYLFNKAQDKVKTTNQMHAFLLEFGISVPRGAA